MKPRKKLRRGQHRSQHLWNGGKRMRRVVENTWSDFDINRLAEAREPALFQSHNGKIMPIKML